MKKYLITLGFCKAELLLVLLQHLSKQPKEWERHIVAYNYYPVHEKRNREKFELLQKIYDFEIFDSEFDRGLHHSMNNLIEKVGITKDDEMCGVDPDDLPSPGFYSATNRILKADPTVAVCACNFAVIDEKLKTQPERYELKEVDGLRVAYHKYVEMWQTSAWDMKFVHEVGGFNEHFAYYGTLESYMYGKMIPRGQRLAYLLDYRNDLDFIDRNNPYLFDPSYREWKDAHLGGFDKSFGEWLKINRHELLEG